MRLPRDYWASYEIRADTLAEFVDLVTTLGETWADRRFIWRGMTNANYALHSSLYRRASAQHGSLLREGEPRAAKASLTRAEARVFREARVWGLQRTATDRLSALELLAALQHQGIPTRLLDFSHNALVALWFAVEQDVDPATREARPDRDGRVFAVQANDRQVPGVWPRLPNLPWARARPDQWLRDIFVWTPPPIDPRMTRQQGCFVFGGVPTTEGGWNIREGGRWRAMNADEIRACVSIPVRMNNAAYISQESARGRPPGYPLAFTVRIPAASKDTLRTQLDRGLGFTHRMMYPDYPGFAAFGRSIPAPGPSLTTHR